MLRDMTGVAVDSRYTLVQAWGVVHGLSQPNVPTIALSAAVAAGILLGNRFAPRLPISLLIVIGVIAASAAFSSALVVVSSGRRGQRLAWPQRGMQGEHPWQIAAAAPI